MKVLTAETMAAVDRRAIEEIGLPGAVLMENAAIGLADAIGERFPGAEAVAIFCGPGNNGGDGLALGRHLAIRGYRLALCLWTGGRELAGDAAMQHAVCSRQGLNVRRIASDDDASRALAEAATCDLVVDALFGTGLSRPLEGLPATLVRGINHLPSPRLAVDLPSGLNGGRHQVFGPAVRAEVTVALGALKVPHVLEPAAERVGEVVLADLGIPPALLAEAPSELELLTADDLAPSLAPRRPESHKGTYGHVLIVAGSPGKAGAAVLAARAAVRGGAGLVTVAVPRELLTAVDLGSVESMTLPLHSTPIGELSPQGAEAVLEACRDRDLLALGPGLGTTLGEGGEALAATVRRIALAVPLPLVLDADGLNAFAGRCEELAARSLPTVLTPHPGELGRLLGISTAEVQEDRPAAARRVAEASGALVVLKGHRTLIANPDGALAVCSAGNPGMATGGTGDVLTGLLAALLAHREGEGDDPFAADPGLSRRVALAVYLHALAGDEAAARRGEASLAAGDLVETLPAAWKALEDGR
ncbi:MAG: NAD(P)H-hydrate dehydratase [Acidobacteriota bacterium]